MLQQRARTATAAREDRRTPRRTIPSLGELLTRKAVVLDGASDIWERTLNSALWIPSPRSSAGFAGATWL